MILWGFKMVEENVKAQLLLFIEFFFLVVQAFYMRKHVDGFVSTGCSSLKVLDGVESLQKP